MSFAFSDILHIISTIDDLLCMSEPQVRINISTDYIEPKDDEDSEKEGTDLVFLKIDFPLKHGSVQIKIYEVTKQNQCFGIGRMSYINNEGTVIKTIEFNNDDEDIAEIEGSFKKAIKQIRTVDRQYGSTAKVTNTPIDRASFGLVEVN
jgi:hypothetical protein